MLKTFFCATLALLLLDSPVQADLILGLKWADGTSSASTRSVENGDMLSVDMFLMDTDGSTKITEGLAQAGGALFQTSGSAMVAPTSFSPYSGLNTTILGPYGPPNFGHGADGVPLNGRANLIAGFSLPADLTVEPAGVGLSNIPLATYALTFNGSVGDAGTINTDVFDSSGSFAANITATSFQNLDDFLTDFAANPGHFGSLNFAINSAAVPEASTLWAACLLLGTGFAIRRRQQISAN